MFIDLQPFAPTSLIQTLSCKVQQDQKRLLLDYQLEADLASLNWPLTTVQPTRRMALWEHSCFECFVGDAKDTGYTEVNFSPNGDWNCFGFTHYRRGMHEVEHSILASSAVSMENQHRVRVSLTLDLNHWRPDISALTLGLAAILKDHQGHRHYYALQHVDGKLDFHHRDSHCLTIPWGIE